MRVILGLALVAVMGLVSGTRADDTKIDGKKLVGKWTPKDEKKAGKMVAEFTKDGKLIVTGEEGGKEIKIDGTYKLSGNKLTMTMKFMDMEMTETVTITKLTDDELEGEDSKGKKETFKRVKDKK
ncbi:MAG TPA: TIGR03066 family protein [Gemmataceae bacterium]|nr:TIGR03066 family protein [Gemmataceae bacterium]